MNEPENKGSPVGGSKAAVSDATAGRSAVADGAEGMTRREFIASVSVGGAAIAAASVFKTGSAEAANASTPIFRIHPAIGVARVGNLEPDVGFIIGPEIPGRAATDGLSGHDVENYRVRS